MKKDSPYANNWSCCFAVVLLFSGDSQSMRIFCGVILTVGVTSFIGSSSRLHLHFFMARLQLLSFLVH